MVMGYQSFPWADGSSKSLEKLSRLHLPNLRGKTFLDAGCNEGFFCGFAKFGGAARAVGIDNNPECIAAARAYFPDCEFMHGSWDDLGAEKYDVILNSSAIHYAADQQKLLDSLVEHLAPGGVLVLEIGVAPGEESRFAEVQRAIDKRLFPTRKKLREMLAPHAWKFIGQSARQAGDPVPREVYHISRRLPYAILLLDDPHAGKSFAAARIFNPEIKRISGDALYGQAADGRIAAPQGALQIIRETGLGDCGRISYRIFREGLGQELCAWIGEIAGGEDFIFDMYVPKAFREFFALGLEAAAYYVVNVRMQRAASRPRSAEAAPPGLCEAWMEHLAREYMIDEEKYLAANPDVARAVAQGRFDSGQTHYALFGRREGRRRE